MKKKDKIYLSHNGYIPNLQQEREKAEDKKYINTVLARM